MVTLVSELRRRIGEEDFRKLRDIQARVARKQQWNLLFASTISWFMLWLMSAGIFKETERYDGWTYFDALYFTFTSLMTIGYGDFYPTSNGGKSFFVFWSLLAVPTITILISSMGDTIISQFKDRLLWLKRVTLHAMCPSRKKTSLSGKGAKLDIHSIKHGFHSSRSRSNQEKNSDWEKGKMHDRSTLQSSVAKENHVSSDVNNFAAKRQLEDNTPYYHYLLIKEISNLTNHVLHSPEKEYSYDEWQWFLTLIAKGDHHLLSPVDPTQTLNWTELEQVAKLRRENETIESKAPEKYIGSEKTEAQWVLEQLIGTLKRELKIAQD
jgi:potassium channel subfamily K, other eukaryote